MLSAQGLLSTCPASADPSRWEESIAAIEGRLKESPPPAGGNLFIGSSSIRLWDLQKSFPNHPTINCGFGGSEIEDSLHFMDRLVFPYQPRVVVFYAGDNDISRGKTAEEVAADFQAFAEKLHRNLPEAKLVYIAIKPSIARWNLVEEMRKANSLIRERAGKEEWRVFVDIDPPMIGEEGKPRPEFFVEDGLHLSEQGYSIWSELVEPHLAK
jgi:lysophospholipase L1-like esterase